MRAGNNPLIFRKLQERIAAVCEGRNIIIMHVCGTHEHTIASNAMRSLLPENVRVVSGPGCPVCITPKEDIERVMELARSGVTVTTFGDMLHVPCDSGTLGGLRSAGADVRIVYSITDALKMAESGREVVHFGIGFETTVPTSSVALMSKTDNFSIYSVHRTIPDALDFLLSGDISVDAFIDPGHVATIIGAAPFVPLAEKYSHPHVVAGFEPLDVMAAVAMIADQLSRGEKKVENEYGRGVRWDGNKVAQRAIDETFERYDAKWRALPEIPSSGLRIRDEFSGWDAECVYEDILDGFSYVPNTDESGCRCGDILLGRCAPADCPLFGTVCTPDAPVGPCMVSHEGTCQIAHRYKNV